MKQQRHQETHPKTDETSSNNENNTKHSERILEDTRNLLEPQASARKRTQCNEERAIQMQHVKRSIKPNCQPTSNSIEKMDSSKRTFEKRAFPKENHRLFL